MIMIMNHDQPFLIIDMNKPILMNVIVVGNVSDGENETTGVGDDHSSGYR